MRGNPAAKLRVVCESGYVYRAVHRLVSTEGEMSARIMLHALRPDLLKIFLERCAG